MKLSIVIPVFDEEGNVGPLLKSVSDACQRYSHEILVINDGSTDNTQAEIKVLLPHYPTISLINLKRNFGQTAAMAAGIDHAQGEFIIPMDGDGQNDPLDIPRLISLADQGFDVVSGWRKSRKDKFFTRKLPSFLANWLISFVTGVPLHDYGCTLKAYRRTIIGNLQIAGEMHRFLPAWCVWQGGKVAEIEVNHRPRTRGKSKYGLFRIFKVVVDLMTLKFFSGYLFKPNYLFSGTGLASLSFGIISGLLAFIDKFGPDYFPPYHIPLLLLAVLLSTVGILLILMGLLAELLVRLYFEVRKQKPYRLENE